MTEILSEVIAIEHRVTEHNIKRTLKDGTVKTYKYTQPYISTTGMIQGCGKGEMHKRITACKNREKLAKLKAFMDEIEL